MPAPSFKVPRQTRVSQPLTASSAQRSGLHGHRQPWTQWGAEGRVAFHSLLETVEAKWHPFKAEGTLSLSHVLLHSRCAAWSGKGHADLGVSGLVLWMSSPFLPAAAHEKVKSGPGRFAQGPASPVGIFRGAVNTIMYPCGMPLVSMYPHPVFPECL